MLERGEYAIEQAGWVCQRCDKFTAANNPKNEGCLEKQDHIYFAGSRIVAIVPKDKLKTLLKILKTK